MSRRNKRQKQEQMASQSQVSQEVIDAVERGDLVAVQEALRGGCVSPNATWASGSFGRVHSLLVAAVMVTLS